MAADEIEQRVRRVLDGLGLPHEMVEIDPQYADTAAFCAQYGYPMEQSANTIVVGSKKERRCTAPAWSAPPGGWTSITRCGSCSACPGSRSPIRRRLARSPA